MCWLSPGSGEESLAVCGARGDWVVEGTDQRIDWTQLSVRDGEFCLEGVRVAWHARPACRHSTTRSTNVRASLVTSSSPSADGTVVFSVHVVSSGGCLADVSTLIHAFIHSFTLCVRSMQHRLRNIIKWEAGCSRLTKCYVASAPHRAKRFVPQRVLPNVLLL